jgi:aminomethyltransferase
VPIGSAFHARTAPLAESLSFRDWSGYYAVSAYETHHDHEYNAIRNACAVIDISPLFKYRVHGPDATRLVDRVITRDATKLAVGQVWYTPWCDDEGKVIDDGTVTRLGSDTFRWTAADPSLRWLTSERHGLDVTGRGRFRARGGAGAAGTDVARLLRAVSDAPLDTLRTSAWRQRRDRRCAGGRLAHGLHGRSRLRDLDAVGPGAARSGTRWPMQGPRSTCTRPACWRWTWRASRPACCSSTWTSTSSRKALIESQKYTPYELGLGRLVDLGKAPFVGRRALVDEHRRGHARQIVGLELDWPEVEALYEEVGLPPAVAAQTSRVAVPVYRGSTQIGRATSTTWSTTLKKMIALATIDRPYFAIGSRVDMEVTVEATRHRAPATVVATPFFNPMRKTAP